MSSFQKYLSIWVAACMLAGVLIGEFLPVVPRILGAMEIFGISIPIAVLIWLMIYPMMLKVDFQSVRQIGRQPQGLILTWIVNWLIKPFSMYAISYAFLFVIFGWLIDETLATQYLAGAVLLGAAPCTAMVFVWSSLTRGNPAYTVIQVATNDLIILVAFAPIVKFLLGISSVEVPYSTLFLSVILFVVIPLAAGIFMRTRIIRRRGLQYFTRNFLPRFDNITVIGLLLTLIIIFSSQSQIILSNPLHILLIAVPLTIQTIFIFAIAFFAARALSLPFEIAAPAAMIGASNFFELAVAVSVALFGMSSPAALATTVGVLTEVPIMLMLVNFANRHRADFR